MDELWDAQAERGGTLVGRREGRGRDVDAQATK